MKNSTTRSGIDAEVLIAVPVLSAAAVIGLATVGDYGMTVDEFTADDYGPKALAWYTSGFTDGSTFDAVEHTLWFYGPWFHIFTAVVQSLKIADHWTVRHALNFLGGLAGIAALLPIGRLAIGRWAGLVAIILCLTTGYLYGSFFVTPIDVPFLLAMCWTTLAIVVNGRAGRAIVARHDRRWLAYRPCHCDALIRPDHPCLSDRGRRLVRAGGDRLRQRLDAQATSTDRDPHGLSHPDRMGDGLRIVALAADRESLRAFQRSLSVFRQPSKRVRPFALGRASQDDQSALVLRSSAACHPPAGRISAAAGDRIAVRACERLRIPLVRLSSSGATAHVTAQGRGPGHGAISPDLDRLDSSDPAPRGHNHSTLNALRRDSACFVPIPMLALIAAFGFLRLLPLLSRFPVAAAVAGGGYLAYAVLTLALLHPLEYVAFNPIPGGVHGAYGRFELDYWSLAANVALRRLEHRLDYDPPERFAENPPSIMICIPWRSDRVAPMFRRPWRLETAPGKADFLITTERRVDDCAKDAPAVLIDEIKRFGRTFAWVYARRSALRGQSLAAQPQGSSTLTSAGP